MVFGFFRKRKEEKPVAGETKSITLDSVRGWIERKISGRISEIDTKAKKTYSQINKRFSDIRDSMDSLENASFEVQNKTYAPVNMVKNLFIKRSHSLFGNQPRMTENPDYPELEKFHSDSLKFLGNLKKLSPKQAILISNYFKKEAAAIFKAISDAEKELGEFNTFLKNDAKIKKSAEDALKLLEEQEKRKKQVIFLEKRKGEMELKFNVLQKSEKGKKIELSGIMKSDEWEGMEELENEIKDSEIKLSGLRSNISQKLSCVARPFKKLEYMTSSDYTVSDEERKVLGGFISAPFDEFIKNEGELRLKELLGIINTMANEKRISLKQKDYEKVLELIRNMDTVMPWLKEKYIKLSKDLQSKKERFETKYSDILERKRDIEKFLNETEEKKRFITSEIKKMEQEKKKIQKDITEGKTKLEKKLSDISGINIKLVENINKTPEIK